MKSPAPPRHLADVTKHLLIVAGQTIFIADENLKDTVFHIA